VQSVKVAPFREDLPRMDKDVTDSRLGSHAEASGRFGETTLPSAFISVYPWFNSFGCVSPPWVLCVPLRQNLVPKFSIYTNSIDLMILLQTRLYWLFLLIYRAIHRKCLSINNLQQIQCFINQAQSRLIKVNQG
jgi:hypothetical protein